MTTTADQATLKLNIAGSAFIIKHIIVHIENSTKNLIFDFSKKYKLKPICNVTRVK